MQFNACPRAAWRKFPAMRVTSHIDSCVRALAHEYRSFLAAVADWARVKEQWLGEKSVRCWSQGSTWTCRANCVEMCGRVFYCSCRRHGVLQAQLGVLKLAWTFGRPTAR